MDAEPSFPSGGRKVRLKLFIKEEYEPPKTCDLDVPLGCDYQSLHDMVCENILGGEGERWRLVKETRTPHLGPDGAGHIDITQEWSSKEATLLTHPADDACPTSVDESELRGGADVYSVMLGQVARVPIKSQEDLAVWWSSHPRPGPPLLTAACARLLAKLRVAPSNHAPPAPAAKLVSEGLAGLRELATDRWYGNRLPLDLLEKGLLTALRWEQHAPPGRPALLAGILEAASAATWALVSYGGARHVLVGAGVVPELVSALRKAQEWRQAALARGDAAAAAALAEQVRRREEAVAQLEAAAKAAAEAEAVIAAHTSLGEELDAAIAAADATADAAARAALPDNQPICLADCYQVPAGEVSLECANRIAYNCLGALAVLAVDARARSACLAVSPKLDFLLDAATTDFISVNDVQHDLDVEAWQRRQERRIAANIAAAERFRRRRAEANERKVRAAQEAKERAEREAAEAAAAAALEAELAAEAAALAAEDPELAALLGSRSPSPLQPAKSLSTAAPTEAAEDTADGGAEGTVEGAAEGQEEQPEAAVAEQEQEPEWQPPPEPVDPFPVLESVAAEDDAHVQQVMAAEALYAMLGRERGVRRAFAAAGGVAALEGLLRSHNESVVCAAVSALASYGRDVGHDHTTGLDMLATAAPPPPPPPPPTPLPVAPSGAGAGPRRSILPVVDWAPPPPKKDPVMENAGKVAASLIGILPPVLEALLARFADGGRDVGGVEPRGVPVDRTTVAGGGGNEAPEGSGGGDGGGGGDAGGRIEVQPSVSLSAVEALKLAEAKSSTVPPAEASQAPSSSHPSPSPEPVASASAAKLPLVTRVTFPPHAVSYIIEMTAMALWSAVAAEQRATELRAAAAAEAAAAAAAAAAEAAAAATAAPPLTTMVSSSSLGSLADGGSSTMLGLSSSVTAAANHLANLQAAAAAAAATAVAAAEMSEADASSTPITTTSLFHISQLAIAAAKLVPSELEELKQQEGKGRGPAGSRDGEANGEGAAGLGEGDAAASMMDASDGDADGDGDVGSDAGGGGSGGEGRDGSGSGGRRGSSSAVPRLAHGHLLGALHGLLGALCVIQGNTRLVRSEFKALLARHAELRRLHVKKELAEDEYQALLEEMEAARRQPGQFFFEHEEEAKREKKRAAIRRVEAEMRRELRRIAAAENMLQSAADAAVRAVSATLTLLPYGTSAGAALALHGPMPPSLEQQLRHCHVLAAGVIQAMASTLQPGAVDAAAAAAAQLQRNWETETSVSAAAAAADVAAAAAAGDTSAEELAAATAAAALYQGPYRDLILSSGVLEALLSAATARYNAATAAAAAAAAAAAGPSLLSMSISVPATGAATPTPGRYAPSAYSALPSGAVTPSAAAGNGTATTPTAAGGGRGATPRLAGPGSVASRRASDSARHSCSGTGDGAASTGGASHASPSRPLPRLASAHTHQHPIDTSTNVLMQATSCALMHLASTENPLQPLQLVAIMSYMRTACHHAASAPYLSAACYSLARHVANRRCMVEGVRASRSGPLGCPAPAAAAGTAAPVVSFAGASASARAAAATAAESLDSDVWVEVVAVLLRAVLTRLKKPVQTRVTFVQDQHTAASAAAGRPGSPSSASFAAPAYSHAGGAGQAGLFGGWGAASSTTLHPGSGTGAAAGAGAGSGSGSGSGAANGAAAHTHPHATLPGCLRSGRFLVMALWLLLRQWAVDMVNPVNMMGSANGLFSPGGYSWWGVRFDADTPMQLTDEVLDALALVVEAAHATAAAAAAAAAADITASFHRTHSVSPQAGGAAGAAAAGGCGGEYGNADLVTLPFAPGAGGVAALRRLATRCVWSLSAAHPAIAGALVDRGSGVLALAAMRDESNAADSELQSLCCGYMMLLASRCPSLMPPLGGLDALAGALVLLVERALAAGACWPSGPTQNGDLSGPAPDGRDVDVPLLEAAVRGLAYLAGSGHEGRVAVTGSRAVRRLVAVVRADNAALEAVRQRRREEGTPSGVNAEELICPLRAINDLPVKVPAGQAASLTALQPQRPRSQPQQQPSQPSQPQQPLRGALRPTSSGPANGANGAATGGGGNANRARSAAAGARRSSARVSIGGTVQITYSADGSGVGGGSATASAAGRRSPSPEFGGSPSRVGGGGGGIDEELLIQSRQSGEADVGLMALWALLNLSGHEPAQTRICRHGLYTLMAAVHGSADPARSAAARAILTNIHYHPGNATVLYKAELKLKYAALTRLLDQEKKTKEEREATLRRMAAAGLASAIAGSGTLGGGAGADANGAANADTASTIDTARPVSARSSAAQRASARGARRSAATEVARQQLTALAAAAASSSAVGGPSPAGAGGLPGAPSAPIGGLPGGPAASGTSFTSVRRGSGSETLIASMTAALNSSANVSMDGGYGSSRSTRRSMSMATATAVAGLPAVGPSPISGTTMVTALAPLGGGGGTATAAGAGDAAGAGAGEELDTNTIAARVRFLKWVLDPSETAGIEADAPNVVGGGIGTGGGMSNGGTDGGADGWMSELTAAAMAAAAGGNDPDLMTTLTSDPEERHWLDMVTQPRRDSLDVLEERLDARCEAGTFMRATLSRSLAGGANSLWREQQQQQQQQQQGPGGDDGGGGGGAKGSGNVRRLRPASDSSAAGGLGGGANRPRSASVQRARPSPCPGSAAVAGGGGGGGAAAVDARRPGSALRASPPVPSLAWPPVARAAPAAPPSTASAAAASSVLGSASTRFVNLYGIPTGVTASSRQVPQPHKPRLPSAASSRGSNVGGSGGGGGGGSVVSRRPHSRFSLQGNPWAPHILRFVQDPPSAGGPALRGELASRMLTAVAPEYVVEDLAGLTKRIMTLTTDKRREEEEAKHAAETAAAASRYPGDMAQQRLAGVSSRGAGLLGSEAGTASMGGAADEEEDQFSYLSCREGVPTGPRGSIAAGTVSNQRWSRQRLRQMSLFRSGSMHPSLSRLAAKEGGGSSSGGAGAAGVAATATADSSADAAADGWATFASEARDALAAALRSRTAGGDVDDEGDDGRPLEPRASPLQVSLLPPVLIGDGTAAGQDDAAASSVAAGALEAGGEPSVISAPPSVLTGGGTLTAVPSTYYTGAGGGIAAASVLSASQAPSGLPHDSASDLIGTASYDTISNVDARLARALHNPSDAYRKPHTGLACPPGTRISKLRSNKPNTSVLAPGNPAAAAAVAAAAAAVAAAANSMTSMGGVGGGLGGIGSASSRSPAAASLLGTSGPGSLLGSMSYISRPSLPGVTAAAVSASAAAASSIEVAPQVADDVPRPVTVLAGSVADLLAAKVAREADAANRLMRSSSLTGGAPSSGPGQDDPFSSTSSPAGTAPGTASGAAAGGAAGGTVGSAAAAAAAGSGGGAAGNGPRTPRGGKATGGGAAAASGGGAHAHTHGSGGGGGGGHAQGGGHASHGNHGGSSHKGAPASGRPPTASKAAAAAAAAGGKGPLLGQKQQQQQQGAQAPGAAAAEVEDPALALFRPQPLSVMVATGDGGTDRLYRFPRLMLTAAHHMCLFEHVDGCRFCEALYGHYLLPNGMLAHFYLGDTVVKGHRVDLTPAPDIPFAPSDWVADGFPACRALAEWGATTPARLQQLHPGNLLGGMWCPVPLTAAPMRAEERNALEWDETGCELAMRSLALEVRLTTVKRTETQQEVVTPPPQPVAKSKKKKGAAGSGKGTTSSRGMSSRGGSRW